ncbi:hypothetical protein [Dysgonomonas termitidis]|uniref:Uncharacterized protein n=1 Tax=Dysgonomonas termitidis TaxID=1516126 RepID=A0ABV9L1R8_9BACT
MKASSNYIANQILRLSKAFPQQPMEFFKILLERIEELEFTEQEITDTVNKCIDTFEYKNLTVATIVKLKAKENEKQVYIIPED